MYVCNNICLLYCGCSQVRHPTEGPAIQGECPWWWGAQGLHRAQVRRARCSVFLCFLILGWCLFLLHKNILWFFITGSLKVFNRAPIFSSPDMPRIDRIHSLLCKICMYISSTYINKYLSLWLSFVILRISNEEVKLKFREIERMSQKIVNLSFHLSFNETCLNTYIYIYLNKFHWTTNDKRDLQFSEIFVQVYMFIYIHFWYLSGWPNHTKSSYYIYLLTSISIWICDIPIRMNFLWPSHPSYHNNDWGNMVG